MTRLFASLFSNACIAGLFAMVAAAALVRMYGAGLPSHEELTDYRPAMLSRVYSGEGKVIAEYARQRRVFAPVEEIPDLVKNAFISAEDKNFYTHTGVDPLGVAKAIARFVQGRAQGRSVRLTGASTITQQVMKNFLVGNARSIERKIKEAVLAVRLDGALSKDQILELYLNEIFLGARSYGVATAARNYFGKPLEDLLPHEAAYLAALPKAPSELHPIRDHDRALARRNYVLREMHQNGHLSDAAVRAARAEPLVTILGGEREDPVEVSAPNHFTAEVRRQLIDEMGREAVYEGGLSVRATIEPELQEVAGTALRRALERFDRNSGLYRGPAAVIEAVAAGQTEGWAEALAKTDLPRDVPGWAPGVVLSVDAEGATLGFADPEGAREARIDLGTANWVRRVRRDGERLRPRRPADLYRVGDVIYLGRASENDPWRLRQIPEIQGAFMAMDPHTGRVLAIQGGFSYQDSVFNRATQAKRQPGSSFKPFVYAAALDAGYSPSTVVTDAPVRVRLAGGIWEPKNSSGKFYGEQPLRNGIVYSRNLMTVRIAQAIGMDRVADYAERFGVYDDMPYHLSYALGAGETTLYDMVAAYGMFANGGKRVRPTVIDRIQDRQGRTLFRHDPRECKGCKAPDPASAPALFDTRAQIMDPVTAHQLVTMMRGVVDQGTAERTVGGLDIPLAGKTGTTNDSRDAWFIGFSPNLVAGCFIGYDTPRPMGKGAYGGTLCGPVFKEFMAKAMASRRPGSFPTPDEDLQTIVVKIDRETGKRLPDDAVGPNVVLEVYRRGTEPQLDIAPRGYRSAKAILSDAVLFGGAAETLPYRIEGAPRTSSSRAGGTSQRQPRRTPSAIGLDSGGLY
ncbi:MAG: PBP1A family penicillin-binding protein [Pseudomonadota bacterium]